MLCVSMAFSYGIDVAAYSDTGISVEQDIQNEQMEGTKEADNIEGGNVSQSNNESDSNDLTMDSDDLNDGTQSGFTDGTADVATDDDSETDGTDDADSDEIDSDTDDSAFDLNIPDDYHGLRDVDIVWGDEDEDTYQTYGLLQASGYPSSYDSRNYNYITSVKNQNPWGSCWAFSTLGAGEASMLKKGYASISDEPDYSEYQLAYFFYHDKKDPLHNIDNDKNTIITGENFLSFGGNIILASFALAGWVGAVDENETGYPTTSALMSDLSNDLAFSKDVAHLQNAYMVSRVKNDAGAQVKKLIMDYGAVASGFYFNTSNCVLISETGDYTYNYQGNSDANHAIMIIGWDDNYPKENLRYPTTGSTPSSNGAWLVKNSWGDSYPYLWVSYEDVRLSNHSAVACEFEPADNYDFNYQYDGTYGTDYIKFENPVIANVYTASGASVESIEAVGLALNTKNVNYSIQIYVNPTDAADPTSGVPMFATPQTGSTDYIGYRTIKLNNPVKVNKGDKFAVVISLSHSSGYVNVFADMDGYTFSGKMKHDSSTSRGQSFFKENSDTFCDCVDYVDAGGDNTEDVCLRIKAYTKKVTAGTTAVTTVDMSKVSVSSVSNASYTGSAITPNPTLTYNGNILKKGTDYVISYSNNVNAGTATVTLTGKGNYKGSRSLTFKIGQINLSSASVTYTNSYRFTNSNITPEPSVKHGGRTLTKGNDYTVSYANNKAMGTATMTITGKGNYTGTRSLNFNITGLSNYETVYNGVDYSAVYDFNYYISKYSDLWGAFGWDSRAALEHFVLCGMSEGRQAKASFDVWSYKNANSDLRRAFGNDIRQYYLHYINNGKYEGRVTTGVSVQQGGTSIYEGVDYSAVYDYNYYLAHNPDVKNAFNGDEDATISHFVNCGMAEGRQGSAGFNVYSYAYAYRDLRNAFKNDLRSYYMHYVNCGKAEGRAATGTSSMQNPVTVYNGIDYSLVYDYNYYINQYGDLKNAFGLDDEAALGHFIDFGMNEGRQGKASFSAQKYKNRYNDLSKAFGNAWKLYYIHYITNGYRENRSGK